jgi:hypothetical protein
MSLRLRYYYICIFFLLRGFMVCVLFFFALRDEFHNNIYTSIFSVCPSEAEAPWRRSLISSLTLTHHALALSFLGIYIHML